MAFLFQTLITADKSFGLTAPVFKYEDSKPNDVFQKWKRFSFEA